MIIAIDGPAGSGKSTTAREVAGRLNFLHLDSGALYRAFAYVACKEGWATATGEVTESRIRGLAGADITAKASAGGVRIAHGGHELGEDELRSARVTTCASKISAFSPIRGRVNALLRELAATYQGGIVCEGRDMGTVVFPEADLKVFMIASPEIRARRRLEERGEEATEEGVRDESALLVGRDIADSERQVAPLRPAPDAEVIDTTYRSFEQQVERVIELASQRLDTT